MHRLLIAAGGAAVLLLGTLGATYAQSAPSPTPTTTSSTAHTAKHPLAGLRREALRTAATTLGLPNVKALRQQLAGSTLTAVAQQHAVQPAALSAAITADLDAHLQALANAGQLKASRLSRLDQKVSTRVSALMTRQFPPPQPKLPTTSNS